MTCNMGRSVHPSSRPHNGMTSPALLGHGVEVHVSDTHPVAQRPDTQESAFGAEVGMALQGPNQPLSGTTASGACPVGPVDFFHS